MRTITLELLRHGPAHGQLLSRLTNYLALCGNHGAQTVQMPFDHNQLLHRLHALEYQSDEGSRQFQLDDTAQTLSAVLGEVDGLTAEFKSCQLEDLILHLRLVISASELALVPFELAGAPHAIPGAGQPLLLQNQLPVCLTREIRRASDARFEWPRQPKILFIVAQPPGVGNVPLEAHLLALRRVLEPWVNAFDDPTARTAQVAEFLTVLPEANVDAIQHACSVDSFTHVHILAHGVRYLKGDDYRFGIALHGRDLGGPHEIVDGAALATLLRAVQKPVGRKLSCPAVVTLACCNSGSVGSVAGAGSSVAHALHEAGIPVVVASQFPLTFAGSVLMVEILYEGLLRGLDPRALLNNLRRQLLGRERSSHDWASIVAYAALPPDFDKQVPIVQVHRARHAIESVLKEADRLVLELSDWWKTTKASTEVAPTQKPREEYLALYRQKITDAEHMLPAVQEVEPELASEIHGLVAGTKKREAQILYSFSLVAQTPQAKAYTKESIEVLRQSLRSYTNCLKLKPNTSWPLHQVLSLSLALGDRHYPHGENWLQSLCLGLTTVRWGVPPQSSWAHTDLIELYLIACDPLKWNGGAQVGTYLAQLHPELPKGTNIALDRAKFHVKELLRLHPSDHFPVETTIRQIVRYREWFTHLPYSLLGDIGDHSKALLDLLDP